MSRRTTTRQTNPPNKNWVPTNPQEQRVKHLDWQIAEYRKEEKQLEKEHDSITAAAESCLADLFLLNHKITLLEGNRQEALRLCRPISKPAGKRTGKRMTTPKLRVVA